MSSPIVAFLNASGPDAAGRTIDQVLAFGDRALEGHHDFIQWLFPLPEPSRAVPGSPVLSEADRIAISGSATALAKLAAATERMLAFYRDTDHWLTASNHNHLRITRIIRSLRLLVGDTAADRFRDAILEQVEAAGSPVSVTSRDHWMRS